MEIKDENTHNSGAADDDALAAIADAVDETSSFGNTRRVAKTVSFVCYYYMTDVYHYSVCVCLNSNLSLFDWRAETNGSHVSRLGEASH